LVADQVVEDDDAGGAMSAVPLLFKRDWHAGGLLQTFSTASLNCDGYAVPPASAHPVCQFQT